MFRLLNPMLTARLYQTPKNAMQSGMAGSSRWVLEFDPLYRKIIEPLMGWTACGDTQQQLKLMFGTEEEARAYAEQHGITLSLRPLKRRTPTRKAYADNFGHDAVRAFSLPKRP